MLYKIIRPIIYLYFKLFFKLEVVGVENIPENVPIVLAPNHKSNLDPIFISAVIKQQIHWMAKEELFRNKIIGTFISALGAFSVNREKTDIKSIKIALGILKNNKILGIFPEGTRVKGYDLKNVKTGPVLIAHRGKALIVPVYIDGDYKIFKNMRLIIKKPIDLRNLPKQSQDDYKEIAEKLLETIYSGVDKDRNYISR